MTNPAQALLDLLAEWTSDEKVNAATRRNAGSARHHDFFVIQNRAVELLSEIERELDAMSVSDPGFDIEISRANLVDAYRAVYGLEPLWTQAVDGPVLEDTSSLRHVASLLRMRQQYIGVTGGDRDALIEMLGGALEEVEGATYLSDHVRAFVVESLARAMRYVRDDARTDGEVRAAVHEASGTVLAAAQASDIPAEKRNWLLNTAAKLAYGTAGHIAGELATSGYDFVIEKLAE